MILYHGSKKDLVTLKNNQVVKPEKDFGNIPDKNFLNGIYLTPEYEFSLVMASKPYGFNKIDHTNKIIKFENPKLFDEDADIFIYTFESDDLPKKDLEFIDKLQYVLKGDHEIKPIKKEKLKAKEILKYYKIINN